MKVKVPFWRHPKLAGKPASKFPKHLRTLLNASKFTYVGAGPRTLDSVVSYIPTLKSRNRGNDNIRSRIFSANPDIPNVAAGCTTINVIICISQRDFPISIHQRLLALLVIKGINLNNVHWVITDVDQLGEYPMFPTNLGPISKTNMKLWKTQFLNELNKYKQYFTYTRMAENVEKSSNDFDLFETNIKDTNESIFEKLKNYTVSLKHIHLFSKDLPWTLTPILQSLDYDPFQSANTYIIGQANSGKTSLLRSMVSAFCKDLNKEMDSDTKLEEGDEADGLIVSPQHIKPSPVPFASKFNVYNVPGMKLIDTPGYVRTEGSIWSHTNDRGAHLLRIPDVNSSTKLKKQMAVCPRVLHQVKHDASVLSGIHIGGLVFIKPWLVTPKDAPKSGEFPDITVEVIKNMPGEVKAITAQDINGKMFDPEHSKVVKEREWSRYLLRGERIELVLDNIGSFTATADNLPFVSSTEVFWEVSVPARVRFLSRSWDANGEPVFKSFQPLKLGFAKELAMLVHQVGAKSCV